MTCHPILHHEPYLLSSTMSRKVSFLLLSTHWHLSVLISSVQISAWLGQPARVLFFSSWPRCCSPRWPPAPRESVRPRTYPPHPPPAVYLPFFNRLPLELMLSTHDSIKVAVVHVVLHRLTPSYWITYTTRRWKYLTKIWFHIVSIRHGFIPHKLNELMSSSEQSSIRIPLFWTNNNYYKVESFGR